MGAWGTSLYANDTTCDIQNEYIDKLKRGKSNEEATKELIEDNLDIMGDAEEEPLFWFALADTQWDYGRLILEVKEKALFFLERDEELERWRDSGEKELNEWQQTLNTLRKKLLSPNPPEKKISKYRLYQCQWKLGDVFAYRFSSDYSIEKGFYGKYVAFRKISEETCWPGHIVPIVQVYKWIGEDIPLLENLEDKDLLVLNILPITLSYKPNCERKYAITLLSTSKKVIPENNLTFLGNVAGDDLIPFQGPDYMSGFYGVGWESQKYNHKFEQYVIEQYLAWIDVDI